MKKILKLFLFTLSVFGLSSCAKEKTLSMEQMYLEKGRPVKVRNLANETFSVYLKFPAEYKSSSESTAYALIPDVVRDVKVKIGDQVSRNEIILTLSEDNASYKQTKLQVENAQNSFNRMELLFNENGVSKQDYDNARTALDVAKEALKQVEDMIYVKAPIAGVITQLNVQKSSNVVPGLPLFTISNQDSYEALFYVLSNEIKDVKTEETAFIQTDSETLYGKVSEVSMTMDSMRKAFGVKADFEGKCKSITSGMNVDVSVETYKNEKAIILHQKEFASENGKNYAYIVNGNKAKKVEIELGRQNGLSYEVLSGLKAGDILICDGVQYLNDGDLVTVGE